MVTTKIYTSTRENLRILAAITGEEQVAIMERAVISEMAKPGNLQKAQQFLDNYKANGKSAKKRSAK